VAKRAKRSSHFNPRQDRNFSGYPNFKNTRSDKRPYDTTNIIDFPKTVKKQVDLVPRNVNQEELLAALLDKNKPIVFATGPAGTGKTYLSMLYAVQQLRAGSVSKIIICRPNLAVDDRDIGFLPGDVLSKMAPWVKPCTEILNEFYNPKQVEQMLTDETIEVLPIAFCRGRTLKNAVVVIDEAQGTTKNSLLSMLTRIGENCKMIVTGDVEQSDRGADNGLADFIARHQKFGCNQISVIKFNPQDVQRHPVIADILRLYKH
jgi:phosphate starvation-inducible PhoH-like protein